MLATTSHLRPEKPSLVCMHRSANLPGNLNAKLVSRCERLICRRIKDLKVSITFANEFAVNVWIQLV
jgi:hypothetical protein